MPLYKVPAIGSRVSTEGVRPDLPDGVQGVISWVGAYDDDTHTYVLKTDQPIEGLTELAEGEDVGFDYSHLVDVTLNVGSDDTPSADDVDVTGEAAGPSE